VGNFSSNVGESKEAYNSEDVPSRFVE